MRNPLLKKEFADREGLTESRSISNPIEWLSGEKISEDRWYWFEHEWFDHGTRWLKNGKPCMLIGQPYEINMKAMQELLGYRAQGLVVIIRADSPWQALDERLTVFIYRGEG